MARSYRNISEFEEEILRLKAQGTTLRKIGEKYGFTYEQVHNFISRYNEKQRKIAAGIVMKSLIRAGFMFSCCTLKHSNPYSSTISA